MGVPDSADQDILRTEQRMINFLPPFPAGCEMPAEYQASKHDEDQNLFFNFGENVDITCIYEYI